MMKSVKEKNRLSEVKSCCTNEEEVENFFRLFTFR
jgi:hypothetical protein